MKVLSVILARSFWNWHFFDLNPRGINFYPLIPTLLNDLYKLQVPQQSQQNTTEGWMFVNGEFMTSEPHPIIIKNFNITTDYLIADTLSNTEDSDSFIADVLNNLSKTFNLPHYEQLIRKQFYMSELFVTFDKSLELINPKLKKIAEYLADNIKGFDNVHFETGSISFLPDKTNFTPHPFKLERATNVPFSEKRFYSRSPLQTDKHIELLNMLEQIL